MIKFIFLFVAIFGEIYPYKYNLSVCAIFQDEAPYLKEWIEYHRILGVEHFWLYNNNSQDDFFDILDPYIDQGIVELIDWPSPPEISWIPYQKKAYNNCIFRSKILTRWLAVIDIDEFIVTTDGSSILDNLKPYEGRGGLFLFWQVFGTAGLQDIPKDKCLVESLTWKAKFDFHANRNSKSICRPDRVSEYHIHGAIYLPPYHDCALNGCGGPHQPIQLVPMHINHYWTRTESFFYEKKIPRRERYENSHYSQEQIDRIFSDYNAVEDKTIIYRVSELRERLGFQD